MSISESIIVVLGFIGVLFGIWGRKKIQESKSVSDKYRITKELENAKYEVEKKTTLNLVNLANKRFPGKGRNSGNK